MAYGHCRWLRLSMCVCQSIRSCVIELVRAITQYPFKLRSLNWDDDRRKWPYIRALLCCGAIESVLQDQVLKYIPCWVCPRHNSPPIGVKISNFWTNNACCHCYDPLWFCNSSTLSFNFILNLKSHLISNWDLRYFFVYIQWDMSQKLHADKPEWRGRRIIDYVAKSNVCIVVYTWLLIYTQYCYIGWIKKNIKQFTYHAFKNSFATLQRLKPTMFIPRACCYITNR